ncbi:hypothetical protein LCGC14_1557560, partial [marine sediment metagenome]
MYDLSQITNEAVVRAPRIVLLGGTKVGKSTFAAGAPDPIFLPIKREDGIDELKNIGRTPICDSFEDVIGWLDFLLKGGHSYKTVVIDSSSTMEPLVHDFTCKRCENASSIETVYKGFGKGYTEALTEWRLVMDYLDILRNSQGMTTILIGHVEAKRFDNPTTDSYDRWRWDINKYADQAITRWADCILFCDKKAIVRSDDVGFGKEVKRAIELEPDKRFLFTQSRASHPGGGRG